MNLKHTQLIMVELEKAKASIDKDLDNLEEKDISELLINETKANEKNCCCEDKGEANHQCEAGWIWSEEKKRWQYVNEKGEIEDCGVEEGCQTTTTYTTEAPLNET